MEAILDWYEPIHTRVNSGGPVAPMAWPASTHRQPLSRNRSRPKKCPPRDRVSAKVGQSETAVNKIVHLPSRIAVTANLGVSCVVPTTSVRLQSSAISPAQVHGDSCQTEKASYVHADHGRLDGGFSRSVLDG